jgi:hypothetical protein
VTHVLIVVSWLGGAVQGAAVSTQEFVSAESCIAARLSLMDYAKARGVEETLRGAMRPNFAGNSPYPPNSARRESRMRAAPVVPWANCTKKAPTSIQVQRRQSDFPCERGNCVRPKIACRNAGPGRDFDGRLRIIALFARGALACGCRKIKGAPSGAPLHCRSSQEIPPNSLTANNTFRIRPGVASFRNARPRSSSARYSYR